MTEKVQVECPAILGRRERMNTFKQYIETNRKDKPTTKIIALYSLETGLSVNVLKRYVQTFKDAQIFRSYGGKLVTFSEFKKLKA